MIFLAAEPPVLTPYYDIIKWTMIIELSIVGVFGIFGIALQWILIKYNKKSEHLRNEVKAQFLSMIDENRSFKRTRFPSGLLNLSAILAVMLEVDQETQSPQWKKIRSEIGQEYLLPKARKLIKRAGWANKLKALRCFALFPGPENEKEILKLLDHKIPVVKFAAAHAAVRTGTESALKGVIDMMSHSSRLLRHPIHDAMVKGGERVFDFIQKLLETETDPHMRLSCIELAKERMNDHVVSMIEKDLHSEHKNLRIGVIRTLGHYKSLQSTQLLLPLLHDPEWEIRALSARSLGYLDAKTAAPELVKLCCDKTWWVRMNAALALKRLGKEDLLKALKPETDLFAYETAQYVLSLDGE